MKSSNRLGFALIITAPSGTGKSTLIKRLLAEFPQAGFSISCTTRSPRPGEIDGKDYHFLTVEQFKERIEADAFAEWAQVHGNYYGTPKQGVLDMLEAGRDVLFDIDVQGARALRGNLDMGRTVFILPPSRQDLEKRLTGRGSDSPETIAKRIANAKAEIEQAEWFDHIIVNDVLEKAYDELRAVYLAERARPVLHPGVLRSILDSWGA
ncbi:MAG: guanylate kinase [Desulfovibrio sp.]|nr:guanylate kinase [Desulfovibrio sp.]MBI4957983.1 guanylate kinase [Desulfovibrio sp.]